MGSAVQRHAAAPWRAWQSVIPTSMATTQSPDTDTLFQCGTTNQRPTGTTPIHTFTTNEQARFPFKMTWRSPTPKNLTEGASLHHPKKPPQAIFLTASLTHGAHLMQPSGEAHEAEDRCFRVSVARRLMMPYTAAPNAADVVQSCPNKSAAGHFHNKRTKPLFLHNRLGAAFHKAPTNLLNVPYSSHN